MDNTEAKIDSTQLDDSIATGGQTEEQLLADIVQNSQFVQPLPNEQVPELDPEDTVTEDPEVTEESVSEEVEEESEEDIVEATDEDATEEVATQEAEVYTVDDLDMDAKVAIKIDGEETEVSFSDLIKGYSTEQHLSKKGRELGDARKGLDEEYKNKFDELSKMSQASLAVLYADEQKYSQEYHELESQIETARKDGDTFQINELKDQRELVQKNYWASRNKREQLSKTIEQQTVEQNQKVWNEQLKYFNETIPTLIPGFDDNIAKEIRKFAIDEGISAEVLDTIADPMIVKFVDDYRKLKQGINKGTVKRKATITKKAPLRKAKTVSKKADDKATALRNKTLSGKASDSEQMDFLRTLAQRSLNL